jgi:hypothetical protein
MRKGLIIQGPLFSPGYGPYEFQLGGKFDKSWIDFDCKQNIISIIEAADNLFDQIVLATWHNEGYSEFIKSLEKYRNVTVVSLQESEFFSKLNKDGIHKYHQIETLRAGAAKLEELECEFVAKIRTDHFLDINLMAKQVTMHQRRNPRSLGVPNINLFELDRLTDFYFVGRSDVIQSMCESYLNQPEYCKDTHKDYYLSFLLSLSNDQYLVNKIHNSENKFIRDFFCIMAWSSYFYPLNPNFFKNFLWRGRRINHNLNGWIRWFFSFHQSRTNSHNLKFVLNLILILSARTIKKPTIKFSSALLFRFYRWRASK